MQQLPTAPLANTKVPTIFDAKTWQNLTFNDATDQCPKSQKSQKKQPTNANSDDLQWGTVSKEYAEQIMSGEAVSGSKFGIVERTPANLYVDHTMHKAIIKNMFSDKDDSDVSPPVSDVHLEQPDTMTLTHVAPTNEMNGDDGVALSDALSNHVTTPTAGLNGTVVAPPDELGTCDPASADKPTAGVPPLVFSIPHVNANTAEQHEMPSWMQRLSHMTDSDAITRRDANNDHACGSVPGTIPCSGQHLEHQGQTQPGMLQPGMLQLIHQLEATVQKDNCDNNAAIAAMLNKFKGLCQTSTPSSTHTTNKTDDVVSEEVEEQPSVERPQKRLCSMPSSSSLPESSHSATKRQRSESPSGAPDVPNKTLKCVSDENELVNCIMIRQGQLATLKHEQMYFQTYPWKESGNQTSTVHLILSQDNGSLSLYAGSCTIARVQHVRRMKEIPDDVDQSHYWKCRLKDGHPVFVWIVDDVNLVEPYAIKSTYKKFRNRHFRMDLDTLTTKVCPTRLLPKGMSLYHTSHFFLTLLGTKDFKRLELTALALDGCTIRVGTTCSGSDIGIIAVKSVLCALQQCFQVRCVLFIYRSALRTKCVHQFYYLYIVMHHTAKCSICYLECACFQHS